jgi:SSS family solute:Na+ symporter
MTSYDTAVLVFYFVFMVVISWVFRRFVHNVSDYFRGGGKALWWMVGGSAFMVSFSAWTFTGAASAAYADGWPVATIYVANAVGFLVSALYFAPRFRQLRVVTGVEAIRQRFGPASEQVFTWLQIPLGTLQAGIWLNALAVFFSAVFRVDLTLTIAVTGLVVLFIALIGGSWAVLASDFIQVLILMPVCGAVTLLALARVGGVDGFLSKLPSEHVDLGRIFSSDFLGLWCLAMLLKQINSTNNLLDASRYLAVKDSQQARWAGYLGASLYLIGIVIWLVPPMAARILFPDLHAAFPQLRNPGEAAFIAISREVMPVGMMGLLVSGIFAATMSSMDSGLNKNAGIFVKNFYQPHLRPDAPDARLLAVGKVATLVLGVVVIFVALEMSRLKGLGLFLLMQRVSILVATPVIVPLLLGLIVRNTPPWSAWSTVLVGFASSLMIGRWFTPAWAAQFFGMPGPLSPTTAEYWTQASGFFANVILGTVWFVGTKLFWRQTAPAYRADVETFFVQLNQPVDFAREEGAQAANDERQSAAIGWLCLVYGGFVALLAAIPNPLAGRLAFVGCGVSALLVGVLLTRSGRGKTASRPSSG